jgi:fucose permease
MKTGIFPPLFEYTLEMHPEKTLQNERQPIGLIILIFLAFIALGMPDGLLGVAWPSMRNFFGLPLDALATLLFCSTAGYLVSSFFNAQLTRWLGVGRVLIISCALTGLALAGYTIMPSWWLVSALGVLTGFGAGAIDASLNTYVAAHYGSRLMQWLHASYGVGITTGPFIMTTAIITLGSWRTGYQFVAIFQAVMAFAFILTYSAWKNGPTKASEVKADITAYKTPIGKSLKNPAVIGSMILFLLYTGTEVTTGTWAYGILTTRGVVEKTAGFVVGSYWAMFTIGRILAGFLARKIKSELMVAASLITAITGAGVFVANINNTWNVIGVALIGMAIAPIFPALVTGTARRVGEEHAANTIGMQMASAGVGAVLLPGFAGFIAQKITLDAIPPLIAFAFFIQLLIVLRFNRTGKEKEARIDD